MATLPNPVIVVPGITAAYLRDDYPLPPEQIWTVLTKQYERAALHPDDLRFESIEPARVVSDQVYEIAYRELIEELRHNLSARDDQPVPVYPFGYDWRKPLAETEQLLSDFIDEVIARTSLLKHYDAVDYADDPHVNLVGHSMGGMVIAGCLQRLGKKSKVAKVATLASPFRGSFEAVVKIATGTSSLGGDEPSSRERETARLTPAIYYLFPSMDGALVLDDPTMGNSLFDPALIQPSITSTLSQYIKLHGLKPQGSDQQAATLLASMLATAQQHRARIEGFTLAGAGLAPEDWLCVAGVDCQTRVRLHIESVRGKPEYDLRSEDRVNHWSDGATDADKRLTGDGTVPFNGAVPGFLEVENIVCVTPDDFGYWEVEDRLTTKVAGFHGILPNMDMLHRLIGSHFTGKPDKHGNIWGRPAPGVAKADWQPAIEGLATA